MLIKIMQIYMPEFLKKKRLKELFCLTADAFDTEMPALRGLTFRECLWKYAFFSKEQAELCLQCGCHLEEVKSRLYHNSFLFGEKLRKSLHVKTWDESVEVLKTFYQFIGIDFEHNGNKAFVIRQCSFSKYYSAEVCALISSMDEGLAAGLSNGGRLCFTQRITDGSHCCKGVLQNEDIAGEQSLGCKGVTIRGLK